MSRNGMGLFAVAAALVVTSAISVKMFIADDNAVDKYNIRTLPMTAGGWTAKELSLTEREYNLLGTRNVLYRDYVNDVSDTVNTLIVYSETDRSIFHSPEGCMIGSGACITKKEAGIVTSMNGNVPVNIMVLEKDGKKDISLFCYRVGGGYTNSYLAQQMKFVAHQVIGRRANGALIRVSMRVDSDAADTLAKLKEYMSSLIQQIDSYIV